jgi:HlyD family secretion protein
MVLCFKEHFMGGCKMIGNLKAKLKYILKKKLTKVVILCMFLLIAFFALTRFNVIKFNSQPVAAQQLRTARVTKGNIAISVTGSGSIVSSNRLDLSPKVSGIITKMYFKEGDSVKQGDLLFELDDSDARLNLQKIKNSISQAELTSNSSSKSINSLNIKAPFSGKVTNIAPKVGDVLNRSANVLTITDVSKLKVVLPFSGSAVNEISIGRKATVYIQELMQSVDGVVTYISGSSYTTALGGEVYDVEITIDNPGSLKEGMKVTAEVSTPNGEVLSTDTGNTQYINTEVIKCDAGGTVKGINVRENDTVEAGELLIQVENDDLSVTVESNNLKMQDLQSQLESAQKQISDYKVYSPINGIIVTQKVNAGDSAKPGTALATISDVGNMEFNVSIDELDIAKIKQGQKVNITADALPETTTKPLTGEVTKIAIEGTSSNGVTTYPVTIKVNQTDKLKVGMNVNAEIMISEKTGVLLVPLEAVTKFGNGGMVFVRGTGSNNDGNSQQWNNRNNGNRNNQNNQNDENSPNNQNKGNQQTNVRNQQSGNSSRNQQSGTNGNSQRNVTRNSAFSQYYANAVRKQVELGINNDSYIEVVSGLNEGDEVILPPLATGSSSQNNNAQMRMPGMGGFGGGFSSSFGGGNSRFTGGGNNRSSGASSGGNSQRGN